uniref:RNase H type-1 domain-containing protein n=1 Tax=Brassica campestris TaxID=3711 RepID=M4E7L3_BRACM
MSPFQEKKGDEDELYMVMKNNDWTDASKNGGLGWCIHGMDKAHDSQSSARILYVVSTLAAEALTLQVALPSASSAGFSKLQEIWDSIVLFSALHSGMDLNEIAGCLLTNFATLFNPLSFNFYQCTALFDCCNCYVCFLQTMFLYYSILRYE